jgi:hypothetical protein
MQVSVSASSEERRVWLLSVVALAVVMMASGAAQQRPDPQSAANDAINQFRTLRKARTHR